MKRYKSLKSYFNDENSYKNVLDIMNTVKGNRELRKFFKGVILCCLEAQGKPAWGGFRWITPDQYFNAADKYDINSLKEQYLQYKKDNNYYVLFGKNVREFIQTMI